MLIFIIIFFGFGDCCQLHNVIWDCPMQIIGKAIACFLMYEPLCHLFDVVFLIAGMIGRFCEVNVKALWALATVPISRSKGDDGSNVVLHRMDFWNVEMG